MKEIELTKGKFALVDDEDFDKLSQYRWQYNSKGYAQATIGKFPNRKNVKMHRMVMDAPDDMQVDHRNKNKLDNQKYNLRLCNNAQNQRNCDKRKTNTSGYKGVSWSKWNKRWTAQIQFNYKNNYLGYFNSPVDAALAYDQKAIELFGDFAKLNFPVED